MRRLGLMLQWSVLERGMCLYDLMEQVEHGARTCIMVTEALTIIVESLRRSTQIRLKTTVFGGARVGRQCHTLGTNRNQKQPLIKALGHFRVHFDLRSV